MFRTLIVITFIFAACVIAWFVLSQPVDKSAKLGYDLVYRCRDTSGVHGPGWTLYYHINLRPPKVAERQGWHLDFSDRSLQWSTDNMGFHFSGRIDRSSGDWLEMANRDIDHSGRCELVH